MDMILDILKQLGADQSVWYQFAIIIILFYVTKFLFLEHLQALIEKREEKTVGLEASANKQFEEISKIQSEYKNKISKANKEIRNDFETLKNEIIKKEETKYREQEAKINNYIEESRVKIEAEINNKKSEIMNEAEQLSISLVAKITKGN